MINLVGTTQHAQCRRSSFQAVAVFSNEFIASVYFFPDSWYSSKILFMFFAHITFILPGTVFIGFLSKAGVDFDLSSSSVIESSVMC